MDQVIMTPEKQRIAIAEACGWKKVGSPKQVAATSGFTMPEKWVIDPNGALQFPHNTPDYLNDLNAMHEAEKMLDVNIESEDSPRYEYSRQVYRIVESRRQPFRSTAAQRAEAFLRTLGKWEESA
jgi:hypothetical protein